MDYTVDRLTTAAIGTGLQALLRNTESSKLGDTL